MIQTATDKWSFCAKVFSALIILGGTSALALASDVYVTDAPEAADVWVIEGPPNAADCWVYEGDISSHPVTSFLWLYVTDVPAAADKWVVFTDNPNAADPISCLRSE